MHSQEVVEPQHRGTFRNHLLRWYDAHGRDLPWRRTKDPYRIWVSEIMLQQTRVGAVLEHYRRFLQRFPTVESLARAREQSVLAAWSGLGYYRRARNLHAAAKIVTFERQGEFPKTAAEWRELPGVGRYTAAAIASIGFGERAAVVDGNVERVLQRVTGRAELKKEDLWRMADVLLSRARPGDFNQAMMELGATICLPREPKCLTCPVMKFCLTRGTHARQQKEIRRTEQLTLALKHNEHSVWLVQRAQDASLMPGMWELPETRGANGSEPVARFKHSILNTDFRVMVYDDAAVDEKGHWIRKSSLHRTALTGLARKVLRHFELL